MIDWAAFITVFAVSLFSACLAVTLFSFGLRFGGAKNSRALSVIFFALCGTVVLFGIYLILGEHLIGLVTS